MRITRLGEGVDRTGGSGPRRHRAHGLRCCGEYRSRDGRPRGANGCGMTATSAARDASNREDFFGRRGGGHRGAARAAGGDEEGRLSFAGRHGRAGPADAAPWLVADIGGGSTELVVGPRPGRPSRSAVRSLDVGCVRMTRAVSAPRPAPRRGRWPRPGRSSPASSTTVSRRPARPRRRPPLVGLAGTVAALAAIDQGLDDLRPRPDAPLRARPATRSRHAARPGG